MLLSYQAILAEGGLVDAALEELEPKTKTFFGDDRLPFTGSGGGPSSLLAAEDVAISELKQSPMGKWDSKGLRQWLSAVLEGRGRVAGDMSSELRRELHMTLVDSLIDHVDAVCAERNPAVQASVDVSVLDKKRKYPDATPSFFGSTTMSHRNKKFYVGGGGNGGSGGGSRRPVVGTGAKARLLLKSNAGRGGGGGGGDTKAEVAVAVTVAVATSGQVFMRLNLEAVLGGSSGIQGVTSQQMNEVIADIRSAMKTR
jgi:hypothetical protein